MPALLLSLRTTVIHSTHCRKRPLPSNGVAKKIADGNGHYTTVENGRHDVDITYNTPYNTQLVVPAVPSLSRYAWQSEEARFVAHAFEQSSGQEADLDTIDLCAITPLDALNLLFLIQKKRNKN